MHTVVSKSRIWGARKSGLEGLLETTGHEVRTEGITRSLVQVWRAGERVSDFRGCNCGRRMKCGQMSRLLNTYLLISAVIFDTYLMARTEAG